jgi:hypothetical protein
LDECSIRACEANWQDSQRLAEVKIISGDTMPPFAAPIVDKLKSVSSFVRGDE